MRELELNCKSGKSKILIGESLKELPKYASGKKTVVVADKKFASMHKEALQRMEVIEIESVEGGKTLETVEELYEKFLELELDRNALAVGIGGGVVSDLVGFAASTYLRGISFGFVPSTLLAQVDAAIGGKNGVNLKGYKNQIGTIKQPEFVLCDFELLKSLPANELKAGLVEIIKYGLIADKELFSFVEEEHERILSLHRTSLEKVVHDSVLIKSNIVSADETEKNERRKLNFGHTLGHSLEKTVGLSHGEGVGVGMILASKISVEKGMLSKEESEKIELLLKKIGLPTDLNELDVGKEEIMDAIRKDKKREGDEIKFVLLEGIGNAKICSIKIREVEKCL